MKSKLIGGGGERKERHLQKKDWNLGIEGYSSLMSLSPLPGYLALEPDTQSLLNWTLDFWTYKDEDQIVHIGSRRSLKPHLYSLPSSSPLYFCIQFVCPVINPCTVSNMPVPTFWNCWTLFLCVFGLTQMLRHLWSSLSLFPGQSCCSLTVFLSILSILLSYYNFYVGLPTGWEFFERELVTYLSFYPQSLACAWHLRNSK